MKFSPILPFALTSLITTSLAAPHALRQPGPVSVGRRGSETVPSAENTVRSKSYVDVAADNIGFGMGEPLLASRKKARRAQSAVEQAADDIGFGTGDLLEVREKEKRSKSATDIAADNIGFGTGELLEVRENEKRSKSPTDIAADNIGFGMGEPLELKEIKERRANLPTEPSANDDTLSAAEQASYDINFGVGEPLLAGRDDPLIRSKVAELSALIKERAPGQSVTEILSRAETRMPDVAAPAA